MSTSAPARLPHQALYRRWRAQTFALIVGQEAVVETLRNAVRLDRLTHGLLFVGPRGTGKTSMARIVAKAVNCLNPSDGEPCDACEPCVAIREGRALDVVELDAASNNRVDDMRELLPRVYTAPADLRRKVFIIDEVQRIKEGWDVLLKTLEEPPPDVYFIFCTTDPSQIRPAVVSRLQRFTFRPLSERQIEGKLNRIAEAEGRTISDDAIVLIAERAAGGMRDAESMLDQIMASGDEQISASDVRDLLGLAEIAQVDAFIDALVGDVPLAGVRLLDELERDGRDLIAFADQAVLRLRQRLLTALDSGGDGTSATYAGAARRLAGLDVNRALVGGYRLQLELALLDRGGQPTAVIPAGTAASRTEPQRVAPRPSRAPASPGQSSSSVEAGPPAPEAVLASPADGRLAAEATSPVEQASVPIGAPPPADPLPGAAGSAFDELQAAWPRVVETVARNPANRPLIMACRPVEIHANTVVLGFPESQAFLRDIAERKRTVLEEALSAVMGRAVAVRCVATNIEASPPLESAVADSELVAHARKVFEDDLLDIADVD